MHKYPLRFKREIEQIGHTAMKHPVGWYFFFLTSSDHEYGDCHHGRRSAQSEENLDVLNDANPVSLSGVKQSLDWATEMGKII